MKNDDEKIDTFTEKVKKSILSDDRKKAKFLEKKEKLTEKYKLKEERAKIKL